MEYVNTRQQLGDQATLDGLIGDSLLSFTDENIKTIRPYAFRYNTNLETVYLPNIEIIPEYAFNNTGIKQINSDCFPKVNQIKQYGFSNCPQLETADFLNLSSIYGYTFQGDYALKSLIIRSDKFCGIYDYSHFDRTLIGAKLGGIYVKDELVDSYKNGSSWKNYNIFPISSYPVTDYGTITDSWEDILESENDGTYLSKYSLGDTKSVMIGPYSILAEIIAFDTDNLSNGNGKAHITWCSKVSTYQTKKTSGKWADCEIRQQLINALSQSDNSFKAAVKEVVKTYAYSNTTYTVNDSIFILSKKELTAGATPTGVESDGVVYDYFSDGSTFKRYFYNSLAQWWLRSDSNCRVSFGTNSIGNVSSSTECAVLPCFCT